MRLEEDTSELKQIATALQIISKEISYQGLANALLEQALSYSGADRGGILLSEGGPLLAKVDADFPRDKAKFFVSNPATGEFRLPQNIDERVLNRQETVLRHTSCNDSAFIDPVVPPPQKITQLFLPLVHQGWTVGVLYLESAQDIHMFAERRVWVLSMLASQAAVSFESAHLFEALRETNMWMVRGQEIGRMGSYRWNTRTLLSRASRECYRIFDIDLEINPVPFEVFQSRIHPYDYPALEKALSEAVGSMSSFRHEYRVVHRDGSILHVDAVGQFDHGPSGDVELEGIITDITERKAAEQAIADARNELARAVRLASVGELAGSIVHEINQPLTGIIMSAEACLRWLARNPSELNQASKSVKRIIEQGCRATDVIASLRSLVKDTPLSLANVDINGAIEEVLLLSKRDFDHVGIAIHTELDKSLPHIEADRVQLQQVVLNLVRNAVEAMAGNKGRSRVLTASSKPLDKHILVAISDTGHGITPADRERLFDAFFSTKGNGLGLGLSICRKIVTVHGGRLWVEENMTHGTTFTFSLPLSRSMQIAESQ